MAGHVNIEEMKIYHYTKLYCGGQENGPSQMLMSQSWEPQNMCCYMSREN